MFNPFKRDKKELIGFYFGCKSKKQLEKLKQLLEEEGFNILHFVMHRLEKTSRWSLHVEKYIHKEKELALLEQRFRCDAKRCHGSYDGYRIFL